MWLGDHDLDAVALQLAEVAAEAGRLLRSMESNTGEHHVKDDGSPTTAADVAAEKLIIARLSHLWPDVPVVAEETANDATPGEAFFLVDPLDGTRDFLNGSPEWTVNIALVDGDRVVAAAAELSGAEVTARVVGEAKGPKIRGFTYKNKTNSGRRWGHRQHYTTIEITSILGPERPHGAGGTGPGQAGGTSDAEE